MFSDLQTQNYLSTGFSKTWQFGNLTSRSLIEMLIKQGQNNIFFLLITLSSSLTFAQNPSTQIEIDFSQIQGVSAGKETFTLELRDSRVYLSPITAQIRTLLTQSNYQNIPFQNTFSCFVETLVGQIKNLCLIHRRFDEHCTYNNLQYIADISFLMAKQLKEKFLYPDNYYPIGTLPSNIVQKAHTTQCCYDQDTAKTLLYGSTSQYNQIINKLKDSGGTSCLKQAGHAVIESLQSHTVFERPDNLSDCRYFTNRDARIQCHESRVASEKSDTLSSCREIRNREDKARCDRLQNDYKIIQERITSLTNLIRENKSPLMSRSSTQLEDIANNNSLTSQISLFRRDLEDDQSCGDYAIGEERIKSSTGHEVGGYTIKRESNGDYTANLFIEFVPSAFYDNEDQVPKDQVQNHYTQRLQSCIDRVNPYLKGPNGQRLNIVIRTPDANSCVPKNTITIWNAFWGPRLNAQALNYPSNLNDCNTITHEVLHLLGLADEYKGTNTYRFFVGSLTCSTWQDNSIMNGSEDRWANVFDSKIEDSLLDPTHFNVILYKGCSKRDDVRLYDECNNPEQTTDHYSCREKKLYCDNQNILGRDKSRELQRIDRMLQELRRLNQQRGDGPFDFVDLDFGQRDVGGIYSKFLDEAYNIIQTLENRRRVVQSWPDN